MKRHERVYSVEKLKRYNDQLAQATRSAKIDLSFTIGCAALALASFSCDEIVPAISQLLQNESISLSAENIIFANCLGAAWSICTIIAGAGMIQNFSRKASLETAISDLEAESSSTKATTSDAKKLVYK